MEKEYGGVAREAGLGLRQGLCGACFLHNEQTARNVFPISPVLGFRVLSCR